jgi:dolichol-phosphate mannosyltransferase
MEPEISVVVPLRDESANVLPLTQQIFEALSNTSVGLELVLVDDASTDDTWQRITEIARTNPRVRGLRHTRNAGQSAALWTGCKASHGSIIATLDGDLQNDPADLPRMLKLLADCDIVCGVRTKRADNWERLDSSRIARLARKVALGVDFADSGCNLRVFKRTVLETLPPFDGLHRFMPILVHNVGFTVKQVPVAHHPRTAGRSKYGVWNRLGRGVRDLVMVRLFLKRQIPNVSIQTFSAPVSRSKTEAALASPVEKG